MPSVGVIMSGDNVWKEARDKRTYIRRIDVIKVGENYKL